MTAAGRPSVTDNARDEEPLAWCPGCGDRIPTEVIRERGVCSNCYGTSDDLWATDRAETTTGAIARGEALAAGDPDWMNVTRWPRTETTTAHECDSGDFDRTICDCGAMHSYCTICGTRQDDCPHGTTTATDEDAARVRAQIAVLLTQHAQSVLAREGVFDSDETSGAVDAILALLATARTRPTRDDLARAIASGYEPDHPTPNRHDYRAADAVLALFNEKGD